MKRLKNENGVITMITLLTVLFIVSFLITSYIVIANKVKTQKEILIETKAIYEPKSSMEEIYNSCFSNDNIVPIYTVEQLLAIGSGRQFNIDEKIYLFSDTATYLLKNNLVFDVDEYATELNAGNWKPIGDTTYKFEGNNYSIQVKDLCDITIIYNKQNNFSNDNMFIELEYIESTGTQYIVTDIYPNFNWKFELKFSDFIIGSVAHPPTFMATEQLESSYYYVLNQNTFNFCNVTDSFMFDIINSSDISIINFDGTTIYYNDVEKQQFEESSHNSMYKLVLFRNRLDVTGLYERYASFKFYSLKFYNEDDIIYNLIPSYRVEDNEIGLYDKINNVFYTNLGTEAFIAGPQV